MTSRKCYGPTVTSEKCPSNALEKGGKGSITEQLLNARPDVTLGGGAKTFAETATAGEWQGKTLREQASARLPDCDRRGFSCRRDGSQSG